MTQGQTTTCNTTRKTKDGVTRSPLNYAMRGRPCQLFSNDKNVLSISFCILSVVAEQRFTTFSNIFYVK